MKPKPTICRCCAGCRIPVADTATYNASGNDCPCPDFTRRKGGSYYDAIGGCCKHIHAVRTRQYLAPKGTPLAIFQAQNPLGALDEMNDSINNLLKGI